MPEDIEKMVDEFLEEAETLEYDVPEAEVWTIVGADADDVDGNGDLESVLEALETTRSEPWYEKLNRELSK